MWPEREGEREHMGDFPYFQAFFGGSMSISGIGDI
jgi:hypothetical protein